MRSTEITVAGPAEKQRLPHQIYKLTVQRWARFSTVGAIGIAVQTMALLVLVRVAGINYLPATALAVEAAILHNFIWHRRWTWADRDAVRSARPRWIIRALLCFNLTTGAVSITGNLVLMRLLVGAGGLGLIRANLVTIALCSATNFLLSDRVVFV
ncbi:MAG TPA: GtrA family protein [Blastocatellia bacterium]|nr:GtrA family protein [Blastocatellia bacterium]